MLGRQSTTTVTELLGNPLEDKNYKDNAAKRATIAFVRDVWNDREFMHAISHLLVAVKYITKIPADCLSENDKVTIAMLHVNLACCYHTLTPNLISDDFEQTYNFNNSFILEHLREAYRWFIQTPTAENDPKKVEKMLSLAIFEFRSKIPAEIYKSSTPSILALISHLTSFKKVTPMMMDEERKSESSASQISQLVCKAKKRKSVDISADEMANSTFGQSSYTANKINR